MGFKDFFKSGRQGNIDKAGKVTTPPLAKQKSKYGDKKMVKAINPKKKK